MTSINENEKQHHLSHQQFEPDVKHIADENVNSVETVSALYEIFYHRASRHDDERGSAVVVFQ